MERLSEGQIIYREALDLKRICFGWTNNKWPEHRKNGRKELNGIKSFCVIYHSVRGLPKNFFYLLLFMA